MKARQAAQPSAKTGPDKRLTVLLPTIIAVLALVLIVGYALTRERHLPSAAVAPNAVPTPPAPRHAGQPAPQFSVQTPLGAISNDTFAGQPYLLELFATWCPHCQRMTVVLRALRAKIPDSRFGMASITASPYAANSTEGNPIAENQADVDAFDKYFGVTWLTAYDANLSAAQAWGLNGFPTIYVVNAKGKIVFSGSGEMPLSTLLAAAHKAGA